MTTSTHPAYVAIIGPGDTATDKNRRDARQAGELLAGAGAIVVTGGHNGVMAAAGEGVASAGGTAIALLPGSDREAASRGHTIVIPTGMGEMRNALIVRTADAVLNIGGSWGTLSELALAVRTGVPVVSVDGWSVPAAGVEKALSIEGGLSRLSEIVGRTLL